MDDASSPSRPRRSYYNLQPVPFSIDNAREVFEEAWWDKPMENGQQRTLALDDQTFVSESVTTNSTALRGRNSMPNSPSALDPSMRSRQRFPEEELSRPRLAGELRGRSRLAGDVSPRPGNYLPPGMDEIEDDTSLASESSFDIDDLELGNSFCAPIIPNEPVSWSLDPEGWDIEACSPRSKAVDAETVAAIREGRSPRSPAASPTQWSIPDEALLDSPYHMQGQPNQRRNLRFGGDASDADSGMQLPYHDQRRPSQIILGQINPEKDMNFASISRDQSVPEQTYSRNAQTIKPKRNDTPATPPQQGTRRHSADIFLEASREGREHAKAGITLPIMAVGQKPRKVREPSTIEDVMKTHTPVNVNVSHDFGIHDPAAPLKEHGGPSPVFGTLRHPRFRATGLTTSDEDDDAYEKEKVSRRGSQEATVFGAPKPAAWKGKVRRLGTDSDVLDFLASHPERKAKTQRGAHTKARSWHFTHVPAPTGFKSVGAAAAPHFEVAEDHERPSSAKSGRRWKAGKMLAEDSAAPRLTRPEDSDRMPEATGRRNNPGSFSPISDTSSAVHPKGLRNRSPREY